MKVLHINTNYRNNPLHQNIVRTLTNLNVTSDVCVPSYSGAYSVIDTDSNVNVLKCFYKYDRVFYQLKQFKILKSIKKNYDVASFDIIHAHTLFTDGNVAYKLNKKYNIPYIVAIRNTDVNTFFKYMVHLRKKGIKILKNASKIVFLSNSYKKRVFDNYVPPKYKDELLKKTFVIPNPANDIWYEEGNAKTLDDKTKVNLVYTGAIDKNKNIITSQKAVNILKKEGIDATFTVIGNVRDKEVYKELKKDTSTLFLPRKTQKEIIEIYKDKHIFIMPSFTETFGMVYAEAMTQGLPCIYTKNEGFDGNFADGDVGFCVNNRKLK